MKGNLLKRILLKSFGFVFSGLIVSAVIMSNDITYSYFTSKVIKNTSVKAVGEKDLVADFFIDRKCVPVTYYSDGHRYTYEYYYYYLVIQPGNQLKKGNVLYFEVEDKLKEYIRNIDPVIVEDPTENIYVPIKFNVNYNQIPNKGYIKRNWGEKIPGKITLKYLNEYLDIEAKFQANLGELYEVWMMGSEYYRYVKCVQWSKNNRLRAGSVTDDMINVKEYIDFKNENSGEFNKELNESQLRILDLGINGYKEYVDGLEENNIKLKERLEKVMQEKSIIQSHLQKATEKREEKNPEKEREIEENNPEPESKGEIAEDNDTGADNKEITEGDSSSEPEGKDEIIEDNDTGGDNTEIKEVDSSLEPEKKEENNPEPGKDEEIK